MKVLLHHFSLYWQFSVQTFLNQIATSNFKRRGRPFLGKTHSKVVVSQIDLLKMICTISFSSYALFDCDVACEHIGIEVVHKIVQLLIKTQEESTTHYTVGVRGGMHIKSEKSKALLPLFLQSCYYTVND